MLYDTVFMLRNGLAGFSYEYKLITSLIGLLICIIDWRWHKRHDYFWVYLVGTIIWTSYEFSLQLGGIRNVYQPQLFGIEIPIFFATLLRGTLEGASITVAALSMSDGLLSENQITPKRTIIISIIVAIVIISQTILQGLPEKEVGGDVASRRDMLFWPQLVFYGVLVIIGIIWFIKSDATEMKKRVLYFYVVLAIFAAVWTTAEYIANTRWIEMGTFSNLYRAPPLIEFGALAYDVVIEIAAAYVPFLIIPFELKLMKKKPGET